MRQIPTSEATGGTIRLIQNSIRLSFYTTVSPLSFEALCSQVRSKGYWQGFQTVSYIDAPLQACPDNPLWVALFPNLTLPDNSLLNRLEYCKIQTNPSSSTKPYSFFLIFSVMFLTYKNVFGCKGTKNREIHSIIIGESGDC